MSVIAQGKPPSGPVDRNWPSFRYPPGGDPTEGRVFQSAADVPPGWLDAPSRPAPPPPPRAEKAAPVKRDAGEEARWRREAMDNAQRLVATEADRDTALARVRELEDFLARVGADAQCPAALSDAIALLLGVEETPAEPAPATPEPQPEPDGWVDQSAAEERPKRRKSGSAAS